MKQEFRKAEDFIIDPCFCEYVLQQKDQDEFWSSFIEHHPNLKSEFEKATELVLMLNSAQKETLVIDKQAELKRLLHRINQPSKLILLTRRVSKYAAVFIAVVLSLFFLYQFDAVKYKSYSSTHLNQSVFLDDSTNVILNSFSSLQVSRFYGFFNREVKLKGEAFFKVTPNPNKKFQVKCNDCNVTVLGTQFNVNTTPNHTQVSVKEGKVAFTSKAEKQQQILTKKMHASYHVGMGMELHEFDINAFAWESGEFVFNDQALPEILKLLEAYYKVDFQLENSSFEAEHLSFYVSKMSLDEVVSLLENLLPDLEVERKQGLYILN